MEHKNRRPHYLNKTINPQLTLLVIRGLSSFCSRVIFQHIAPLLFVVLILRECFRDVTHAMALGFAEMTELA